MLLDREFHFEIALPYFLSMGPIPLRQSNHSFVIWNTFLIINKFRLKTKQFIDRNVTFCSNIILSCLRCIGDFPINDMKSWWVHIIQCYFCTKWRHLIINIFFPFEIVSINFNFVADLIRDSIFYTFHSTQFSWQWIQCFFWAWIFIFGLLIFFLIESNTNNVWLLSVFSNATHLKLIKNYLLSFVRKKWTYHLDITFILGSFVPIKTQISFSQFERF